MARTRRRPGPGVGASAVLAAVLGPGLFAGPPAARAAFAVAAVAALVSLAALFLDALRSDDAAPAPSGPVRRRAADALAEAVRDQWSAEALVRALWDPEPLDVRWRLAERGLTDHPENIRPAGPLPGPRDAEGRTVGAAFAALPRRRLVVLGGAGSGKSVLALRLTLELLSARAPGKPVPVLFPLAGWDPTRTGLRTWLVERLLADHRSLAAPDPAHGTLAGALVASGLVLPVLDGFDELPPAVHGLAVGRINAELGATDGLLLTSRGFAWQRAVREGSVLTGAEVIRLLPLEPGRALAYLERWAPALTEPAGDGAVVAGGGVSASGGGPAMSGGGGPASGDGSVASGDGLSAPGDGCPTPEGGSPAPGSGPAPSGAGSSTPGDAPTASGGGPAASGDSPATPGSGPAAPEARTAWTPVVRRLRAEPRLPLARALRTPLMVSLARAVYADGTRDPAELLDPVRYSTVEHVEARLLKDFVPAAFGDVRDGRWSGARALHWLGRLARESERRGSGQIAWWELHRTVLWIPLAAPPLALGAWGRLLVARAWLAATGRAPWRLMAFLDEAHRRGVLRQAGGRYEFRHLRLRRELALTGTPDRATDVPPLHT
ncbi:MULTISPECIES: NACHT domain-containing protein [unclassified Streptomyces]|uniref:NACHT domain-containing protein n=1 Tax=unclassified Streptomyces TaxID=2593676 RepID=UPI00036677FB|nr:MULTISPECIES: NACHT domain-containing protein [unclassified Streptomyces]